MKYYIIAGEASGDLHGSNLIKSLKLKDKNAEIRFWGGDLMKAQGGTLIKHYNELAFMGFLTVLLHLKTILNNIKFCKNDIKEFKPDVIILIDYPGFNLRIAKFAHNSGFKVYYYISPKIWAWKQSRIKKIKKFIDKMYVIFPFEKEFYNKFNYSVDFQGNPLIDALENREGKNESFSEFILKNNLEDKPIISLLAGSRKQEIKMILPEMLKIIDFYKDYQFVIAAAPSIEEEFYQQFINDRNVKIIFDQTYQIVQQSDAALVTSGTATLETALLSTPQVVCYKFKGGKYAFLLGMSLLKVKYISLVNLIMNDEVIKELIQHNLNIKNLKIELDNILFDKEYRQKMLDNYKTLKNKMGKSGASDRVVGLIYKSLQK
ncbi:MAG: lipid-A-disaccharide synthase [Bacteroidetes bacterium]|nr:MAG: lipid-A-disaccharide synthase [Bacteroidota bacterium]